MKDPEKRKSGEGNEAYIRRIAKLPILSADTIIKYIFINGIKNGLALLTLREWLKGEFPELVWDSYKRGPWDFDNHEEYTKYADITLDPARIPTKKFAEWVVNDNILEAWRGLGEEPTPHAELFIELVHGKTGIKKNTTQKPKAKRGRWEVRDEQREAARKAAKRIWKQDKTLTIDDMISHDEINRIAPNWHGRTLRDWLKDLSPSNKPGRPKKK